MKIIAISSLIIFCYAIYCAVREIVCVGNSLLNEKQQNSHTSILLVLIAQSLVFTHLVFTAHNFMYGFYTFLIKYNAWLIFVSNAIAITAVTRYFRKQRKGEDLVLDVKKEIVRSVTFGFSKRKEFEALAKDFLDKFHSNNQEAYYIDQANANIDQYKNLKKGEKAHFGFKTYIEKVTNKIEHNYNYVSSTPIIFGIHVHSHYNETLTAIEHPIQLYMLVKNKLEHLEIKKGQSYTVKKGVPHGVLIYKPNKLGLKWT